MARVSPGTKEVFDAEKSQEAWQDARREYVAGLDPAMPGNRFMRNRYGLGGTGDAHLDPWQLWSVRETARHMDRNDALPGQAMERLVDHLFASPWRVEPDTGDPGLDAELKARWLAWSNDKQQCDYKAERTFDKICWLAMYQTILDGDIFALLLDDGRVQLIEAERCVSPSGQSENIHAGVELRNSIPVKYHFSKKLSNRGGYADGADVRGYPIYNAEGLQVALHSYRTHRVSGNRGYSWWTPVMVEAGMLDDLDFAMVLKAQQAAAISGVIESAADAPIANAVLGTEGSETTNSGDAITTVKLRPGALPELPPGKKLAGFTPNVPNSEHMRHVKYQLQKMGGPLHLPYVLLMLDASETNFSGWRGAMDAARYSFMRIQRDFGEQMVLPTWRWQVRRWMANMGPAAQKLWRESRRLAKAKVVYSGFRYIQPKDESAADSVILANRLNSPRGLLAERGRDYDDIARETIEDNRAIIQLAIKAAEEINKKSPDAAVNWREVARWQLGTGINLSGQLMPIETEGE